VTQIAKGVGGPQPFAKLLAGNYFRRPLKQDSKNIEGPVLQFDPSPVLA
jgi:hypothetical protein